MTDDDKKDDSFFQDDGLWEQVKASVKPLKKTRGKELLSFDHLQNIPPWEKKGGLAPFSLKNLRKTEKKQLYLSGKELYTGDLSEMDGRNAERLRKGKLHFDGQIDLHGFKAEQAWHALKNFITYSYHHNRRCVLVVTGKGWKAKDRIGVLRSNTPKWLNAPEIRPFILGFSRAQSKDGGEGAFYVMIKRNRSKK